LLCHPILCRMRLEHPDDHQTDKTILLDPSGAVWADDAPNLSRPDPTGADQINAEHQPTELAVKQ
jgi:hypothetical protein